MEAAAGGERGQPAAWGGEVVGAGSEWPWGLLVLEWMMGQEVMDPESEEPVGSVPRGEETKIRVRCQFLMNITQYSLGCHRKNKSKQNKNITPVIFGSTSFFYFKQNKTKNQKPKKQRSYQTGIFISK